MGSGPEETLLPVSCPIVPSWIPQRDYDLRTDGRWQMDGSNRAALADMPPYADRFPKPAFWRS